MEERTKRALAVLGSPHKDGATGKMLDYAVSLAEQKGYSIDYVNLYEKNLAYCTGCRACMETSMCVQKDDIQEIAELLKACDMIILAAPVYWANVPAVVKNLFDRLLGVAMEETKTFPKARLSKEQKYILLTACNTPAPFSGICGQSTGAVRAMKEFFGTAGMSFAGKCVWTGQSKTELPERVKRRIERIIGQINVL